MKVNLIEYFLETKNKFPNKIAIDDNDGKINFEELDNLSNKFASKIFDLNIGYREPIAVFLPKNRFSVACFLSIFKTGNFYVPIDLKSPMERISKILETLETKVVLTDAKHRLLLESTNFAGNIICIDEISEADINSEKFEEAISQTIDLDPIYSIFTSGSTGIPKGVVISHRGVIDYIEWAKQTYAVTQLDAIGNQAPFYFDNSTLDIFLMICTGATLHIIPEDRFAFPVKLIEYINTKEVNLVFWVPSVLVNISNFDVFSSIKPSHLNKILFAGESMPNKHLNYWRKHYPESLYSNLYGPTEITVDCTYYIVDRAFSDDESLPIGKACKNTQILILNDQNKIVTGKELGELCVRGSSLAFGYYNDLEKTKSAFMQNPLHNKYPDIIYRTGDLVYYNDFEEIIFVGRKDSQIKHMGYRIELGEIENAILGIPEVENVAVLYDEYQKQIIAFVITQDTPNNLRKKLNTSLPKYMIPTRWQSMQNFPLNANGKINRLELKKLI